MTIPERVRLEIEMGLGEVNGRRGQVKLRRIVETLAADAWRRWMRSAGPDDNHPHHEATVFRLGMKIAAAEKLDFSSMAVLAAFAFYHDNYKFKRIMDARVRDLEAQGLDEQAEALRRKKREQREKHMTVGARRADALLREMGVLTERERRRCVRIIERHDCWKLGEAWPLWKDRLAVCCFEADALWPLQPLGVLADIERAGEDLADPRSWRSKVRESHGTLLVFRANWNGMREPFQDRASVFRTREGYRIYRDWCEFWDLDG